MINQRAKTGRFLRRIFIVIFSTMCSIPVSAFTSQAQEQEIIEGGRYLYKKYCSTCHGVRGYGDGLKAPTLKTAPANLTLLRKNNGGKFPFWEIYRVIDGRQEVLNHGPRDMPVWGIWFRIPDDEVSIETEWADQVRGRIWQLIAYLKSIQQ